MAVVDTHIHIFARGLPLAPVRRYVPEYDATIEDYRATMRSHGISHAVIVQPSFLGVDNRYMCQALRSYPDQFRGIAVVAPAISDDELGELDDCGVVGIRLNLEGMEVPDFAIDGWPRLLTSIKRLDWLVEVQRDARDLPKLIGPLINAGINVLVDHFARPDAEMGVSDPGFRYVLAQGRTGLVWVKLSAPYRNGANGKGLANAPEATSLLLEHFGRDRLVWGSDWPHTNHESHAAVETSLRQLESWIPDPVDRVHVAGASALALFRFDERASTASHV